MRSYAFADLEPGVRETLVVHVRPEDVDAFAALSGDVSPIHVDDAYARQRGFTGRIAHGLLLGAYVSQVIGTLLPGATGLLQTASFEFRKPCYPSTTIHIEATVQRKVESLRVVRIAVSITDVATGDLLVTGHIQSGISEPGEPASE